MFKPSAQQLHANLTESDVAQAVVVPLTKTQQKKIPKTVAGAARACCSAGC